MKILYNGLCINGNMAGVQYYADHIMREALKSSPEHYEFHALISRSYAGELPANGSYIRPIIHNRMHRILYEHSILNSISKRYDITHCPAYILPGKLRGRGVITIHDTIALDFPELCKNSNALYFNLRMKRGIRDAAHIITVSEKAKEDIIRNCNISPDKITAIYPGIDPIFRHEENQQRIQEVKSKYALPDRYMLFTGNIEPKKNLPGLLRAYDILLRRGMGHKLVIVGQWGWKYKDVLKCLEIPGLRENICFLNYVERADLPAIYSLAGLFVFPSIYEGFGFPPLEAMACGTPVVASYAGALQETTGGNAVYVDPYSPEDIASKIELCLTDDGLRERLIRNGYSHACSFTWDKAWKQTLNVYKAIL